MAAHFHQVAWKTGIGTGKMHAHPHKLKPKLIQTGLNWVIHAFNQ
jgi:hypothetical protein